MEIKKAVRKSTPIKMSISGPSGSGKTWTALNIGFGLTGNWEKICVIDTENKSSELYAHLGEFSVLPLDPPFTPENYIEAIKLASREGFDVVIIDSATHEWSGLGGCLQINEKIAQDHFKGNTWSAWSKTTPRHDKFIQTMLQSRPHVIACFRSKTETAMMENKTVKKIGMKDEARDGTEYEFTIVFNLDRDTHTAIASKDRTGLFPSPEYEPIGVETGIKIRDWINAGHAGGPIPTQDTKKPNPEPIPEKRDSEGHLLITDATGEYYVADDGSKVYRSGDSTFIDPPDEAKTEAKTGAKDDSKKKPKKYSSKEIFDILEKEIYKARMDKTDPKKELTKLKTRWEKNRANLVEAGVFDIGFQKIQEAIKGAKSENK